MSATHDELVERAARWLRNTRRCAVVFTEPVAWSIRERPDAIGFTSTGKSIVVEAKTCRSDFLADQKKPSRLIAKSGGQALGSERWYLAEPGVIPPAVDLGGWGILELRGERCYRRLEPSHPESDGSSEVALLAAIARRSDVPWSPAPGSEEDPLAAYPEEGGIISIPGEDCRRLMALLRKRFEAGDLKVVRLTHYGKTWAFLVSPEYGEGLDIARGQGPAAEAIRELVRAFDDPDATDPEWWLGKLRAGDYGQILARLAAEALEDES